MNFVDLYKYEIGDKNNEPQKFQTHVVNWEVVTHKTENRIVSFESIKSFYCHMTHALFGSPLY